MNFSVNPNTQARVEIPADLDDRPAIDAFLAANAGKKVVVVQGLGFVGAVMSLVCANTDTLAYAVIGVDLPDAANYWKIKTLNEGGFPLSAEDPKIEQFYRSARERRAFLATFDPYAYSVADVVIVDINLDVKKQSAPDRALVDFGVDLSGFKAAMRTIGRHCAEDVLVLIETTVPPGTSEKVALPILREALSARGLSPDRFCLGHSYERVMPGPNYVDSIQSFYRVYSGIDTRSADATEAFLRTVIRTDQYPLTRLGSTTATEMAKVLENSYRAMNIAFMVEWSRFAEEASVNLYEVVQAIRMRPTHANMMLPGVGVGGYCLTKDPLLASWARQNFFADGAPLGQSEAAVSINDRMPGYAFEHFSRHFGRALNAVRVLLLGVSYRGDVGDTRFSPVDHLFDRLQGAGAALALHDPFVHYWDEKHLPVGSDLDAALAAQPEVVMICTGHSVYKGAALVERLMGSPSAFVYDTIGVLSAESIALLRTRHTVKVLGRGDL
ncbi:MAG: nucleotide sugar dehydrogenase [Betaproteobacteria bacterium]|nr:nucleotide sugar dehydrogenase [Betaproteobacteria bacterium]